MRSSARQCAMKTMSCYRSYYLVSYVQTIPDGLYMHVPTPIRKTRKMGSSQSPAGIWLTIKNSPQPHMSLAASQTLDARTGPATVTYAESSFVPFCACGRPEYCPQISEPVQPTGRGRRIRVEHHMLSSSSRWLITMVFPRPLRELVASTQRRWTVRKILSSGSSCPVQPECRSQAAHGVPSPQNARVSLQHALPRQTAEATCVQC
jgi:hypothetical protein